jgi:chromosome segregation ATPase
VGDRTPEELERALAASERKVAELQAWADSSDAEGEQLRARVAELEAAPAPPPPPAKAGGASDELQMWLEASEAEVETLRAQLAEATTALQRQTQEARKGQEAQAWLSSAEEENEALKARVEQEEKVHQQDGKQTQELQQWLDAAEAENEKLKAALAQVNPEEATYLRERVAELETAVHSLTEMNKRFSGQVEASARRDVERLSAELLEVKQRGNPEKMAELQATLENAREAIATLESERGHAVAQVQRYASRDSKAAAELKKHSQAQLDAVAQEKDARIAVLQASLGQREAELKTLEGRLGAHVASGEEQKAELERLRVRECEAREQLGQVRSTRDELESRQRSLDHQVAELAAKLAESKAWLETAEQENEDLEKKLEGSRLENVMRATELADAAEGSPGSPPSRPPSRAVPAAETEAGTEGFSVARLRRLESLLSSEQTRTETLLHFLKVSEKSLSVTRDALEVAQGKMADLARRLQLSEAELGDLLAPLKDGLREVGDLSTELALTLNQPLPPPPPLDAFETELVEAADVVSAPLQAVEQLAEAQAAATRQAADALQGEQRAREQLLGDLAWLKTELDKLSSVRDELRTRLGSMVQRELKRKAVVTSLLDRLRATEATTASRAGALKRLQAALTLAQRMAVKVQTVYFQKQIGSLSRQLDAALGKKRVTAAAPTPGAPPAPGPRPGAARP